MTFTCPEARGVNNAFSTCKLGGAFLFENWKEQLTGNSLIVLVKRTKKYLKKTTMKQRNLNKKTILIGHSCLFDNGRTDVDLCDQPPQTDIWSKHDYYCQLCKCFCPALLRMVMWNDNELFKWKGWIIINSVILEELVIVYHDKAQ